NIHKGGTCQMSIKNLTTIEGNIIAVLVKYGSKTYYDLYTKDYDLHGKKERIGSRGAVNQALKRLLEKGLIEIREKEKFKTGLEKKYYRLTFLGLHYAIVLGFVEPKEAINIMKRDKIRIPTFTYDFKERMKASCNIPFLGFLAKAVIDKLTPEILFKIEETVIKEASEEFFSKLIQSVELDAVKDAEEYAKLVFTYAYLIFIEDFFTQKYRFEEKDELKEIYETLMPDIKTVLTKELDKLLSILRER
ncbi:MAG: hypothetical protein QW241_05315, partial [Candidatus Bathyarchaeia archaeon]